MAHVLITGANRGVGAALRTLYVDRGDRVTPTRRDAPGGDWLHLDVTDPERIAALSEAMRDETLDLLICNAGVLLDRDEGLADGYPADIWASSFAVNVTGVFQTVQACLPALRRAPGKIAILSSQLGSHAKADGGRLVYRASKAAALNLGLNLASELRSDGIAVGIYHPGWVQTDMGGSAAAITPEQSATGLVARFDALSLKTTGCFQTWDGRDHPL